jgi:Trk K+ transport system NAD-binding subunit
VDTDLLLVEHIRKKNKTAIIIVVAHQIEDAKNLYDKGATYVIMPYFLGGQYASTLIHRNGLDLKKFLKERDNHLDHLHIRKKLEHEHPKAEKDK